MIILLILILILVPFLLGTATLKVLQGNKCACDTATAESYITGLCVVIGIAEVGHVLTVILSWPVARMTFITTLLTAVAALIAGLVIFLQHSKNRKAFTPNRERQQIKVEKTTKVETLTVVHQLLMGLSALSILFQIILLMTAEISYREADMTLETVRTFQETQALYQVNPLTGQPYTSGVPMRLKILCLPGLYTVLCEGFGLDAELVIGRLIPAVILLASYGAYYSLGRTLFKGDRTASLLFLLVVSVLYWLGDYMMPMDGFLLLHCGYRGTAIRNGVLLPFVWNMCLNKKWLPAALAILAEACIVWTLYGLGYCLASAVVILVLHIVVGRCRTGEGRLCRNS